MIAVAIVWFARTVIIISFIEVIHIWLHFIIQNEHMLYLTQ